MILEKGSKLIMIGDSVTDCGRNYDALPAGWGSFGDGYVNLVNAFLTGLSPKERITVINKGVSGNTIVDLKKRWQADVLDWKPEYVSIMIGINDVWRHFDSILQPIDLVDEKKFRDCYMELMEKTKDTVKEIFILSPFMMIEEKEYPMRKMVERYAAAARETAEQFGAVYIDIQSYIDRFLEELPSYVISSDHVHPNTQGHAIVAKAFLDAVGFEWK